MTTETNQEQGNWVEAVDLMCRWEKGTYHLDDLLEGAELGRLRWLLMEVFRLWLVIDRVLEPRLKKSPRPKVHQLLRLAVGECINRSFEYHPKIVHNAGEVARHLKMSKPERGFLNAVLRSVLRENPQLETVDLFQTHPAWMMDRWKEQFGEEATKRLLEWNQSPSDVIIRAGACPDYAEATPWEGYFKVMPSRFKDALPFLTTGEIYAQDPFTRIPVELLAARPGEKVMDLCAAPGGKTRLLAEAMQGQGNLIAVDKPGKRLERLAANLSSQKDDFLSIAGCRLQELESAALPEGAALDSMDAVLIDVPCSNTGVIRRRPDVKLRLKEREIARQAAQQSNLLKHAARWVRPGGRLVYSTCSLEREENAEIVDFFCKNHPGWKLEKSVLSLPWEAGQDGGGAFLLTREIPG